MPKTFYLIDGHAQIYRAFYAPFGELTSPSGEPTRATHVFCNMLLGLIRDKSPDYLAIALDSHDETVFRCDIDPNYKANREAAPEGLHLQADRIISIVETMGIQTFRREGFEADDLIATIAETTRDLDVTTYIVSKDKDLEQLLTDRVFLYDLGKDELVDPAKLLEKKGYPPDKAVEIQTLTGDATDNVPGVVGIGVKTAAKLIEKYGSADAVLAHADELTPKQKENVRAFASQLSITRQLVTLRRDVPMAFELSRCEIGKVHVAKALPVFEELGFGRLCDQLLAIGGASPGEKPRELKFAARLHAPASGDLTGDTPVAKAPDYRLVNTPALLDDLAKQLEKQPQFAFDTETTGLNPVRASLVGVSISWQASRAYYIPVRGTLQPVLPVEEVVAKLRPAFENPEIGKVGHNLKYDLLVMRQVGIDTAGPMFDTMIAGFCLDPTRPSQSLDGLSKSLLGHDKIPFKELCGTGKNQITIDQCDVALTSDYACEDADYTWRLMELFERELTDSSVEPLFRQTEMPLVEVLTQMEHEGVALDIKSLTKLGIGVEEELVSLRKQVHQIAEYPFNIDSPKQLAVVLFDELGLRVVKKTKTGRSTDAETLETLTGETDNPIPGLVLQYRQLAKLKSTYIDTLPTMVNPKTGRIHTSFSQTIASTGRLSSRDPNLQNIPIRTPLGKRIRATFIAADEEHVLLAADYSQIELRVLAHYCQDRALMEAFASGVDIHRSVAAQINGVSLGEVTTEQRSAAKAVNFGIIYGQTPFGLSRSLGIPVSRAKTFIETYFLRYPGIADFVRRCVEQAKRQGYAETILGRRRPIVELGSRNAQQRALGERLAVNTVIQGSAADLIKRAMIDIHQELQRGAYTARMLIQVHDELVFEVAKVSVEAEAGMIRQKMVGAMTLAVPIAVDIGWGPNWLEGK